MMAGGVKGRYVFDGRLIKKNVYAVSRLWMCPFAGCGGAVGFEKKRVHHFRVLQVREDLARDWFCKGGGCVAVCEAQQVVLFLVIEFIR